VLLVLSMEGNQCMTLVMAENKTNNIHMRLSDEELQKLDKMRGSRMPLLDRTKFMRTLIEEAYVEHQRRTKDKHK